MSALSTTTASRQEPFTQSSNVRSVNQLADIAALFEDGLNVVVLTRSLGAALAKEAERAASDPTFALMTVIDPRGSSSPHSLNAAMRTLPALTQDIQAWAEVLFELTDCKQVGTRLQRVESAMCPRWHVDKVVVRVVCALFGATTEFLEHETSLGVVPGVSESRGLPEQAHVRVRRAQTGDVLFLKGDAWPNHAGRGAVHRSPAADRTRPRLLLTLDPLW